MFEKVKPEWTLVEACAGSAALSMHYLGMKKQIVPYQGSKWRYRNDLRELINSFGFLDKPNEIHLYEPGPWGHFWYYVFNNQIKYIIRDLKLLNKYDPKNIYDLITRKKSYGMSSIKLSKIGNIESPSAFIFLQRLSFSGKAITYNSNDDLVSPGFNKTSAYGKKGTDKFGEVKPLLPSLIERMEELEVLLDKNEKQLYAFFNNFNISYKKNNLVIYIDPPYKGSTGYGDNEFSRKDVVASALKNDNPHSLVIVSEAEPIKELNDLGWASKKISSGRSGNSPFKTTKEEWVTVNVPELK